MPGYMNEDGSYTISGAASPSVQSRGSGSFGAAVVDNTLGLFRDWVNYRRQSKLMDKQYQMNLEQWERQNEYDSPQAQMARLQAAGLNPDLIYGQMGNGSPAQMMATEQNVSSSNGRPSFLQAAQQRMAFQLQQEQLELNHRSVESQIDLNEALAHQANANAGYKQRLTTAQDVKDALMRSNIDLNYEQANYLAEKANEAAASARNLDSRTMIANIDAMYKDAWWRAEIAKLKAEAHLSSEHAAYFEREVKEMVDSWKFRLSSIESDSNIDKSKMYVEFAQEAMAKLNYTYDAEGRPIMSKRGAAMYTINFITSALGQIFGMSVNRNTFDNVTSRTTKTKTNGHSSVQYVTPN